jgi:hypothetical protein
MVSLNQLDANTEKELHNFIASTIVSIAKYYTLDVEMLNNCPSFTFTDDEHYGEEIHKIDPNTGYTDDGSNKGMGKTICKNGKVYIIINSQILNALIQSEYKNIISKHVIYHELGHWMNYMLNPELSPEEKPCHSISLLDGSRYLYSVAIDEYMANNYIAFLLSKDDCIEILRANTLYTDIENLYTNICEPLDLFYRLWNSPNAIFINLLKNISFFQKTGGFKETEELEIMNIKGIMAALDKPERQFDIIYHHLVRIFNTIVADYNSDNPSVLQKPIR